MFSWFSVSHSVQWGIPMSFPVGGYLWSQVPSGVDISWGGYVQGVGMSGVGKADT